MQEQRDIAGLVPFLYMRAVVIRHFLTVGWQRAPFRHLPHVLAGHWSVSCRVVEHRS